MARNTKTVLKGFDYMHCDDFAKYLSNMAAKGWHFKEWGVGLKFEKGEPKQAVYAVEVFTKASENDMRPEPNTQEFAAYCEAAGWKFIDAKQKFCIFKKVDENAVTLFTPEERINNAFKGTLSGSNLLLLALFALNAVLQWVNMLSFFEEQIFSVTSLFTVTAWTLLFFAYLVKTVYAFYKRNELKNVLKQGGRVHIGACEDGKYHVRLESIYLIVFMGLFLGYLFALGEKELVLLNGGVFVVTLLFAFILNKIRPSSDANIVIQLVFSFFLITVIVVGAFSINFEEKEDEKVENLPVLISDYRECDDEIEEISVYKSENILGSVKTYFAFGEEESIYYNVYRTKHDWILDKIWEEELEDKKYNEELTECSKDWGAKKAFRNKIGIYYVRYENAILVFSDDIDIHLTVDQINIIRDKLDLR
ncbi:MAG: DUF2812 domain-containing protein [Agathobacter sp.]|nr:DUF2812 domain-containing protein [Agathobacter sp.]